MYTGLEIYLFAGDTTDNALYQVSQLQSLSRLPRCCLGVGCLRSQTKPQAPGVMIKADDPCNDHLRKARHIRMQCRTGELTW